MSPLRNPGELQGSMNGREVGEEAVLYLGYTDRRFPDHGLVDEDLSINDGERNETIFVVLRIRRQDHEAVGRDGETAGHAVVVESDAGSEIAHGSLDQPLSEAGQRSAAIDVLGAGHPSRQFHERCGCNGSSDICYQTCDRRGVGLGSPLRHLDPSRQRFDGRRRDIGDVRLKRGDPLRERYHPALIF